MNLYLARSPTLLLCIFLHNKAIEVCVLKIQTSFDTFANFFNKHLYCLAGYLQSIYKFSYSLLLESIWHLPEQAFGWLFISREVKSALKTNTLFAVYFSLINFMLTLKWDMKTVLYVPLHFRCWLSLLLWRMRKKIRRRNLSIAMFFCIVRFFLY